MHLEALKNRLESSISPHIVAAFMQHKTDEAKRYFNIFTNLDRYDMGFAVAVIVGHMMCCTRFEVRPQMMYALLAFVSQQRCSQCFDKN